MENNNLGLLIGAFIIILVGVVLIDSTADEVSRMDDIETVTNESISISATSVTSGNESITIASATGSVPNGSIVNILFFGNATNSTHLDTVRVGIEVNFSRDGQIALAPDHFDVDSVYNISFVILTNVQGDTTEEDVKSIVQFSNATIGTEITGIDVNDEVNFTYAGKIRLSSYNFSAGLYNITYTHEGDNYLSDTTSRTLINLVVLFFALAILMVGYHIVRKAYENMGF